MIFNCDDLLRVPWTARRYNQSILKKSVLTITFTVWLEFPLLVEFICLLEFVLWYSIPLLLILELLHTFF